jgi:hypothetical protein
VLPNARHRLILSAKRLDELAEQAERVDVMKAGRGDAAPRCELTRW